MRICDAKYDPFLNSFPHLLLHNANVAILVYSIDNKNSFDQLYKWAEHLQDKQDEMFIVIIGSKSDLAANRAVPAVFAQRLKNEMPNCKFTIETSAYENIGTIT